MLDKHAPLKEKRVRYSCRPEWWNSEIANAIRTRDRVNKTENYDSYKYWRTKVKKLIFCAKRLYYNNLLSNHQKDVHKFWKAFKDIVPSKKSFRSDTFLIDQNYVNDPSVIANSFNDYFKSAVNDLLQTNNSGETSLSTNSFDKISKLVEMRKSPVSFFDIPPLTIDFVRDQLLSLKINMSTGTDRIPAKFLRLSAHVIAPSLTGVFNYCIARAHFPSAWKLARVTPIHKKGPRNILGNYRPISILPTLSKILERHVHNSFTGYMEYNNLFLDNQSGFRAGHSCETALTTLVNDWSREIDKGSMVGAVLLDLSKAFDLVSHSVLLSKLKLYGCTDNAVSFFNSYLSSRKQFVRYENHDSNVTNVEVGVPQGSILGPLLFITYVNDLSLCLNSSLSASFADDTSIYATGKNIPEISTKLNKDLTYVSSWCSQNGLCINTNKSKSMLITSAQKRSHLSTQSLAVSVNNITLDCVANEKLLGVMLNHNLDWSDHIRYTESKVKTKLYLLSRVKRFLTIHSRKIFYCSFIQPHLYYCCNVWGTTSTANLEILERIQRRAIRLILDTDSTVPTKDLYLRLNWLPLGLKVKLNRLILVFKALRQLAPNNINELFKVYHPSRYLRSASQHLLEIPRAKTEFFRRSFQVKGANDFNSLPFNLKQLSTVHAFKKECHNYLLTQYLEEYF